METEAESPFRQEDNAPQHKHRLLLFAVHAAFSLCQRMWDFSMVVFLSDLVPQSLAFVALLGIAENFVVLAFSGVVGKWLDRTDRLRAATALLAAKAVVFGVTMALLLWQFSMPPSEWDRHHARLITAFSIPFLAAAARLCFSSITLAVEKDWVVVLSADDSKWLSSTNSIMSQLDLGCDSLGPALMGVVFATLPLNVAVLVASTINLLAVVAVYCFLRQLYHLYLPLQVSAQVTVSSEEKAEVTSTQGLCRSDAISAFLRCGCTVLLVAYAMTFLTVLSFHSLMTAYVLWRGLRIFWVGLGRGLSALSGFIGASFFPTAVRRIGLVPSATTALWFQFALIAVAGGSFFLPAAHDGGLQMLVLLLLPIVLSRAGLWLFDLAIRQIAQETIQPAQRGTVNGVWRSLIALFELTSYVLALWLDEPRHFWILACVSVAMVGGAVLLVSHRAGATSTLWSFWAQLAAGARYHKLPTQLELAEQPNASAYRNTTPQLDE